MTLQKFKHICIASFIASLLFIPTHFCGKGGSTCYDSKWEFLFTSQNSLDISKFFLQELVLVAVLFAIKSEFIKK
jgi:hypothetical protein